MVCTKCSTIYNFFQGYDNSESYIITQDPIQDVTVSDFWRMISEQSISTIVMLSDVSFFFFSHLSYKVPEGVDNS